MKTNDEAADKKARIFLVDDHPIVRRGFQLLLNLEAALKVCGEADNAAVAMDKILSIKPDLAIVDLSLKSGSGLELIKQLRASLPNLKILVFTMQSEGIYAERAIRAGANGYVTKEEGTEKAVEAIHALLEGKTYFSDQVAGLMMERMTRTGARAPNSEDALSDRELEILALIGNGLGSREIAEKLGLSMKTIESHREHIKSKLGLKRASELVNYAFKWVQGRRLSL